MATPLHFGPPERRLFGWLHRADKPGEASRVGLVICNPFGYEAICSHRSLQHFACAAASMGATALRFDYDGTGDSAGEDRDPERLASWTRSVGDAIDVLRARGDVDKVCLLGVRLGATLAMLAAAARQDVDGVCAIAPIVSGRAYLRELKLLQAALGLAGPPAGLLVESGIQEALGFEITDETRAALHEVDLMKLQRAPATSVLLLERDDMPPNDAFAARLHAVGASVDQRPAAGYVEMVLDPHKAVVPREMLRATCSWLADVAGPVRSRPRASAGRGDSKAQRAHVADGVVETPLFVDDKAARLFGILSQPADPRTPGPRRLGILLMNAGAVHHIGPNRMYVRLARGWARRGHTVLRLDVSGIGDSLPREGGREGDVYTQRAQQDMADALALLRARGADHCVVAGVCSGAYNAFKAAADGLAVDSIIAINPATFSWREGMSLDVKKGPYTEDLVVSETSRYLQRIRDWDSWKKLLRGEVKLAAGLQILGKRGIARAKDQLLEVGRRVGWKWENDLGSELESAAKRSVGLHFVFAAGESGIALLEGHGGGSVSKLEKSGKLTVEKIEGPDHTFTSLWSQDKLVDVLEAHISRLEGR